MISINKTIGQTPYDVVKKFKAENPTFSQETVSYAGRLDPMAEGLLLLLIGDENKKRHKYEKLKKTYEFSVLFGIRTDSYDLLGMPSFTQNIPIKKEEIQSYITNFPQSFMQTYPPFSSKPVNGIPLYRLSREQIIPEEKLPKKKVTIFSLETTSQRGIDSSTLLQTINDRISRVHGNFRQKEILHAWEKLLGEKTETYPLYDFIVACSSGTYVRSIAHNMGKHFKVGALAFSIKRTAIGEYTLT